MSVTRMQTSVIGTRHQDCRLLEPVVKRVSIGQAVDHFQRALINLELFGPGIGVIIISGALLLISLFQQPGHCGTSKGVI
jgi:hypothetical protein